MTWAQLLSDVCVAMWLALCLWVKHRAERDLEEARSTRREVHRMLAEMRRCNEDLAECVALANYGATEEAIEVASRWRRRMTEEETLAISHRMGAPVARLRVWTRKGRR